MRSPSLAIAWELWGASRQAFVVALAALPGCALLYYLCSDLFQRSELLRGFSFLPMCCSLLLLFIAFNFTESRTKAGFAGFPARLFTLPVGTPLLVTCPMAYGASTIVLVYSCWAVLLRLTLGAEIQVGWPALLLAAGMVCYQALIWSLAGFRLTRLIALSVAAAQLVGVGLLPYALGDDIASLAVPDGKRFHALEGLIWITQHLHCSLRTVLTIALLAVALLAYVGALVSVEGQRRGGGRGWGWWRKQIQRAVDSLPRRRRPFRSPAQAQFWLEWRRSGLVLPACVAFIMVVAIGPLLWLAGANPSIVLFTLGWCLFLPIGLAAFVGFGLAKTDFWSKDLTLSAFLATRPLSSGDFVITKAKVAAQSALVSWLIVLVFTPLWLALWCDMALLVEFCRQQRLDELWQQFQQTHPPITRWPLLVLSLVVAYLLTWMLLVRALPIGLFGRLGVFLTYLGLNLMFLFAVPATLVVWFATKEERLTWFLQCLPWIPWPVVAWGFFAVFVFKLWGGVAAWHEVQRQGLVTSRTVWNYLGIWLTGTACLAALAHLLFSTTEWFQHLMALGALSLFPLARIGLSPLALARNRHR